MNSSPVRPHVHNRISNTIAWEAKSIREHLGMTPDQLAPFVGAKTGAEIEAYENDEDDLLVSVLFWSLTALTIRRTVRGSAQA
jgi:hypothetical protein